MSKPLELPAASNEAPVSSTFFDTQELRSLSSDSATPTELLMLSRDAALIEVVRRAAPSLVQVVSAGDIDEVADKPGLNPGVLVVDTAITSDVHSMLPQLQQHFPEIVIVVVGTRENVSALMRLTASGHIFRFLLVPLAHGQTRLALGAAVAHHLEVKAANVRTGAMPVMETKKASGRAYIALGAGLLVALVGIWWGIGALTQTERATAPIQDRVVAIAAPDAAPMASRSSDLELAKTAFAQGNYLEPAGRSALDLYKRALELDPDNMEAQAGVRAVADKVLGNAERALTTQRLPEALADIEVARRIDPANPRLQFLDVQVTRERERLKLDQERDRTASVRRLIQQASVDMAAQRYLRPRGANARDALLEARKLDPTDPAIGLAMNQLIMTLTEAAKKAAATGDVNQAKQLIDGARSLGASEASIAAIERSFVESARVREARSTPTATPDKQGTPTVTEGRATASSSAMTAPSAPRAETVAPNAAATPTAAPPIISANPDQWLQAMDLPRSREVAPDYPSQAFINGIEGWVDVDFTISPEGVPDNLRVRDSSPRRVFDRAALDSVRQWRFEPILDNGVAVSRRATLRVRFQRR